MAQTLTPGSAAMTRLTQDQLRQRVANELDFLRERSVDDEAAVRDELIALARRGEDPPLLVEALLWKNFRYMVRGRPVQAQALREQARAVALACGDGASLALCEVGDAGADYANGCLAEAVVRVRRALPMFEGHRNALRCRVEASLVLTNVYAALHLYDEAGQVIVEAQRLTRTMGDIGMTAMFERFELQLKAERANAGRLFMGQRPADDPEIAGLIETWQRYLDESNGPRPVGRLFAREQLFNLLAVVGREDEALAVWADVASTTNPLDIYPQHAATAVLLQQGPQPCIEMVLPLLRSPDAGANPSELADLSAVLLSACKRQGDYASALVVARDCMRLELNQSRAIAQSQAALFALELDAERDKALAQRALVHTGKLAAVGQLASSLAHEVSQPLGALMLLAHEARAALATGQWEQVDEVVGDIEAQAERLGRLIERMRDFSRDAPPRLQVLDLRDVVDEAHRLCKPAIGAAHVAFQADVPELTVNADKERVMLAMVNLVSNALETMRGQTTPAPLLRVEAALEPGDAQQVRLSVVDNGPGLNETVRARLFQPFFTTKSAGLGLGLTITRQALEGMGARLEGGNEPGRGARFSVVLKAAR